MSLQIRVAQIRHGVCVAGAKGHGALQRLDCAIPLAERRGGGGELLQRRREVDVVLERGLTPPDDRSMVSRLRISASELVIELGAVGRVSLNSLLQAGYSRRQIRALLPLC